MTVERFNSCLDNIRDDTNALGSIYCEYYDRVYATAIYYVKNRDIAHDITSEVFLKLANYRKTEPIRNPNAFLCAVAKNCALSMLKNERKYQPLEWDNSASTQDLNQNLYLNDIFSVLTDEEQQIVLHHVFWGYKLNELTDIVGHSYPTIKRMYKRIKEKIKAYSIGTSEGEK